MSRRARDRDQRPSLRSDAEQQRIKRAYRLVDQAMAIVEELRRG